MNLYQPVDDATPGGKTMEANDFRLSETFSSHVFSLFKAQRPYLWDDGLALKLLEDFLGQIEDGSTPIKNLGIFSLSMMNVCVVDKVGSTVLEILDGQQRLVTLCLILAAIRKKLLDGGEKDEARFAHRITDRLWQPEKADEEVPAQPRLELKKFDVAFFNAISREPSAVEGSPFFSSPPTITQENIWANLKAIMNRLEDCTPQQCIAVTKYIMTRTHIIVARYRDTEAALQVYRTGNMTTGMKLAAMDLLKAEVLELVPLEDQLSASQSWEKLEQQLGREQLSMLFRHLITIELNKRHSINTEVVDLNQVERGVEYFLRSLSRLPERARDGWVPAALVLAADCRFSAEMKVEALRKLERLAWFLLLGRADLNAIHERFGRVTQSLRTGGDGKSIAAIDGLELSPEEKFEFLRRLEGPIYTIKGVPRPLLIRLNEFVLSRIDQSYVQYDVKDTTLTVHVEHILPQNIKRGSGWERDFPDEVQRGEWVHRLGNLMLLSGKKNAGASDKAFEHKKTTYFLKKRKGAQADIKNIPLTDEVARMDSYLYTTLEERQSQHLNYAKQCWELYH